MNNTTALGKSSITIERFREFPKYNIDNEYALESININEEIERLKKIIDESDFISIGFEQNDYLLMFGLGVINTVLSVLSGVVQTDISPGINNAANDFNSSINRAGNEVTKILKDSKKDLFEKLFELLGDNLPKDFKGKILTISKETAIISLLIWFFSKSISLFGQKIPGMESFVKLLTDKTTVGIDNIIDKANTWMEDPSIASSVNRGITGGIASILEVVTTEVGIRMYMHLKYENSTYRHEAIEAKLNKMLLISHAITTVVSTGKAYFTSNPFSINAVAIFRVIKLGWDVIKQNGIENMNMHKSIYASTLIASYQTFETLVIFDNYLYYSNQVHKELDNSISELESENIDLDKNIERLRIVRKRQKKQN